MRILRDEPKTLPDAYHASRLMGHGIELVARGTKEHLDEALACFTEAAAIREKAGRTDPWSRYELAGSWLNGADACAMRSDLDGATDALGLYERAIEQLPDSPDDPDPLFARRRALAWLGKGRSLLRLRAGTTLEAARSFEIAAQAAGSVGNEGICAEAFLGQAEAYQTAGSWAESSVCACKAISSAARAGMTSDFILLSLKARLALCLAASRPGASPSEFEMAVDAAEDGLRLAAGRQDEERLWGPAHELLRWCANAYAARMPQFLLEFLSDNRDLLSRVATPGDSQPIEEQATMAAIASTAGRIYSTLGKADSAENLTLLTSLTQARRLASARIEQPRWPA